MAGIKIVDLPPLGRDLAATDLLELSLAGGTGSRKITGQEIMNASKLNVNNTPIINGTVGRVLFQGTGNVLQQSSSLFWDATNNRLGIGTETPSQKLSIVGNNYLMFTGVSAQNMPSYIGTDNSDNFYVYTAGQGSGKTAYYGPSNGTHTRTGSSFLDLYVGNGAPILGLRLNSTGNILIGTTTDAGFKLDVNGTARVQGTLKLSNNITTSTQNGYFEGNTAGNITNTSAVFNFQYPTNATSGTMFQFSDSLNTGYVADLYGNKDIVRVYGGFKNPNSSWIYSDIKIDPTYQGVGNGVIVRGIYYNPTNSLTGTYTHRAIDLTSGDFVWGTGYSQYYGNSIEGFIQFNTSGSTTQMWMRPPNNTNNYGSSYYSKISHTAADLTINSGQYGSLYLGSNGANNANASMVLHNASANTLCNVLIGTTTNAGYRLDVNGTARVQGNVTVTGTNISISNAAMSIDSNVGTGIFNIINNSGSASNTRISLGSNTYLNIYQPTQSSSGITSGTINTISTPITYAWSSGTVQSNLFVLNPTINNTGTYNGTFRGFYYNPTLTSLTGTTHFAFHSTSGRVRFEGLPTSPTGLNAGDIYNDGGILKIV